jgi:acetyltransferase-like isoleucine patch superfamily enzyme
LGESLEIHVEIAYCLLVSQKNEEHNFRTSGYPLDTLAKVGRDVYVNNNVEIRNPHLISIGSHVAIDFGFFITTSASIGDYIHIGPFVSAIGGATATLELQDLCSVAAGVRLICLGDEHLGEGIVGALIPKPFQDKRKGGKIVIERFAALGTNSIVMPGFNLREGAVLGANSLLMCETEPWTIYVGSPAKPIKERSRSKILSYAAEMGYSY